LDIVVTAQKRNIHGKDVMRDALIGLENIFEIAESGREAMCLSCGRLFMVARYTRKSSYLYA